MEPSVIPTAWRTTPLTLPVAVPIPPLAVRTHHRVSQLFFHLPGVARGSLVYTDIHGRGWYRGYAMVTHNRGRKRLVRTLRGIEDSANTTR